MQVLSVLAVADANDPKYSQVDQAIEAYLKGDLATAEKQCRVAVATHNELPPAMVMLAQMHFGVGRMNQGRRRP